MTTLLVVLIGGQQVATLRLGARGRWTLRYAEGWRSGPASFPLSVSMPLAASEHGPEVVEAWAWGLLPDNAQVLERWARNFQVSARSPFPLLAHVGEDCPGAVQIVPPARVAALAEPGPFEVDWLSEAQVGARLALLERDHAAWRAPEDLGWFSLAGAQPKTALLEHEGRWGVPRGRTPTTHILKPPLLGLDGHVENEHFCLSLARSAGLPAAASRVLFFAGHKVIAVERYDRVRTARLAEAAEDPARAAELAALAQVRPILRLHQEDLCQALGLPPTAKYQAEGGPSAADVVRLLRTVSSRPVEDVGTFVDALAFAWLIGGTDAHAKNYALLHGRGGQVRLAPLYDLASTLPYFPAQKQKLAMKVGGDYRLRQVGVRHWRKLGEQVGLDADALVDRVRGLAARVGDGAVSVARRCREQGLELAVIGKLEEVVVERAARCRDALVQPG